MHLSRRKGRLTEQQASIRKFLDRSKESIKRLKALKFGLGMCEVLSLWHSHYCLCAPIEKSSLTEVKEFYSEHNNDVFYVVYGSFTTLETSIQDKCKPLPLAPPPGHAVFQVCPVQCRREKL